MREIRIGDECLSKCFGYGKVNSVGFNHHSLFEVNVIEVLFPIPNWDSARVVKAKYTSTGFMLSFNLSFTSDEMDMLNIKAPKSDVNRGPDSKFLLKGVRHVLFEKTFGKI